MSLISKFQVAGTRNCMNDRFFGSSFSLRNDHTMLEDPAPLKSVSIR